MARSNRKDNDRSRMPARRWLLTQREVLKRCHPLWWRMEHRRRSEIKGTSGPRYRRVKVCARNWAQVHFEARAVNVNAKSKIDWKDKKTTSKFVVRDQTLTTRSSSNEWWNKTRTRSNESKSVVARGATTVTHGFRNLREIRDHMKRFLCWLNKSILDDKDMTEKVHRREENRDARRRDSSVEIRIKRKFETEMGFMPMTQPLRIVCHDTFKGNVKRTVGIYKRETYSSGRRITRNTWRRSTRMITIYERAPSMLSYFPDVGMK